MPSNAIWIVLLIAVIVSVFVLALRMEAKRKRDFFAAGLEMGFFPVDPESMSVQEIPLFGSRRLQVAMAMEGSAGGYKATLFETEVPQGKARVRQTVIAFLNSGANMPLFKVRRKIWLDRITSAFNSDAVRFPDSPAFDERVVVHSPDAEQARKFFTPDLQNYLLTLDGAWTLEGFTETFAVYRAAKRVMYSELRGFVDVTASIAQGFLALVPKTVEKSF
jgi:hypothetical protein